MIGSLVLDGSRVLFIFLEILYENQKQPPEVFYKKRLFLKFLQYSQENPFVGVSF